MSGFRKFLVVASAAIGVTVASAAFAGPDPAAVENPWLETADMERSWDPPLVPVVVEPWAPAAQPRTADVPELLDPWQGHQSLIPTRSFPPVGVVDPWMPRSRD